MDIDRLYGIFKEYPLICTDTRKVQKGSIFFALKGENFDGNQFAAQAVEKGCNLAVVDNKEYYYENKNYLLVEDALHTLQKLANLHRRTLNLPILAITGTNGKTTTKELTNEVLSKKYMVFSTQGNLNNHIGVPLTLLSMSINTDIGIVEMGANHAGEIKTLCEIAEPDFGLITNIGKAHLEGFGSFEGVKKAKRELYDHLSEKGGEIFINIDNKILRKLSGNSKQISYGTSVEAKCRGEIAVSDPYLTIVWHTDRPVELFTGFAGGYNFENVMAAICVGSHFNVPENDIVKAIESYTPDNNRSQLVRTANNTVIMDAYNANPTSMEAALENFFMMKAKSKVVILGDMLELGKNAKKEHKIILEKLMKYSFDRVFIIGKIFGDTVNSINYDGDIMKFQDTGEFNAWIKDNQLKNTYIFIKGSRGIGLERILPNL